MKSKILNALLFSLLFFIVNSSHSQNEEDKKIDSLNLSIGSLKGTTWQVVGSDAKPYVIEFTKDKMINYFDGVQIVYDYYLSTNQEKKFDKKKIGKNTKGTHLIAMYENWKKGDTLRYDYMITKFNKNFLVIKNVDRDITTKFKRVVN